MEFKIKFLFLCTFALAVLCDTFNQDYDGDLSVATSKFAQLLSAALQPPSRLQQRSGPFTVFSTKLKDVDGHDGGDDFYFENTLVQWTSPWLVDSATPNMKEASIQVKSRWDVVTFSGVYGKRNEDEALPIEVSLQNIEAEGVAGYSVDKSEAVVENMRLSFSVGNIFIKNAQTEDEINMNDNLNSIIENYFERDISEILRQNLKDYLNDGLSEVLLEKIFDNDSERIEKYRAAIQQRAANADQLTDYLLKTFKAYYQPNDISSIDIPDIHEQTMAKWGFIKVHVTFNAVKGRARDFSSIHRVGSSSIDGNFENGNFTLHGNLAFNTLAAYYDFYRLKGPLISLTGSLDIKINQNAMSFSISGRVVDKVLKVKDFNFRITKLDDVKVKATGVTPIYNWLLSIMATMAGNAAKGGMLKGFERGIQDAIYEQLKALKYEIPLGK